MVETSRIYLVSIDNKAETLVIVPDTPGSCIKAVEIAAERFAKEPRFNSLRFEKIECRRVWLPGIEFWWNEEGA